MWSGGEGGGERQQQRAFVKLTGEDFSINVVLYRSVADYIVTIKGVNLNASARVSRKVPKSWPSVEVSWDNLNTVKILLY